MLTTHIKPFCELSASEVYEILKARCDVFTVEQKICYPDMDDIDYDAIHVSLSDEWGIVQAYLRLFREEESSPVVHVGRVLSREHHNGMGRIVMQEGIRVAKEMMGAQELILHSQEYCIGFYEKLGFKVVSDTFIEAEIPHVTMTRTI